MYMGEGRKIRFREEMQPRADAHVCMEALLKFRIIFSDMRVHFDYGPKFTGRGGTVGQATTEMHQQATDRLREQWGQYVNLEAKSPKFKGGAKQTSAFGIKVSRRNPTATR